MTNAYEQKSKATVTSIVTKDSQTEITLDQTLFYPQGGGQPSDQGLIKGSNGQLQVNSVNYSDGNPIHQGKLTGSIKVGDAVGISIDWDRRYQNMRDHSAGHIVHEAVQELAPEFKALGAVHGIGKKHLVKYQGIIDDTLKDKIEEKTNSIIDSDESIETRFVTYDELVKLGINIPDNLPKNKPLRIIQIGTRPPMPDGGTQVAKTSEVGHLTITEIEYEEGNSLVHYKIESGKKQTKPTNLSQLGAKEQKDNSETLSLSDFQSKLNQIENEFKTDLNNHSTEELKTKYTSKNGLFTNITKSITSLSKTDRGEAGKLINQLKNKIESSIINHQSLIIDYTSSDWFDLTIPGDVINTGHLHPTTLVIREMNSIFAGMGFSIYDGPEIETDEYNYDRLNLPADHPARDLQDSLYIEEPNILLRTQTSSIEAHILETFKPPYRFAFPGKVYRYENMSASNNVMFYQYQGLAVGSDITLANLKWTLSTFVHAFFGKERETRFRCKYYPEVEPGVGVDISCQFCNKMGCTVCKGRGWIEMLGAGMVHPNMLRRVGLDPKIYSGYAWGMGLDRIVMQRYGIPDIRALYNGDISYKG